MSFLIKRRISEWPGQGLQLLNGKLYCSGCEQILDHRKAIVDFHIYTIKHQTQINQRLRSSRSTDTDTSPQGSDDNVTSTNVIEAPQIIGIGMPITTESLVCSPEDTGNLSLHNEVPKTPDPFVVIEPPTCLLCNYDEIITNYEMEELLLRQGLASTQTQHDLKKYVWTEFLISQYETTTAQDGCFPFCAQCSRKLLKYQKLNFQLTTLQIELEALKEDVMNGLSGAYFNRQTYGSRFRCPNTSVPGHGQGHTKISSKTEPALEIEMDVKPEIIIPDQDSDYEENSDLDWHSEKPGFQEMSTWGAEKTPIPPFAQEMIATNTLKNFKLKPCTVRLAKLSTNTRVKNIKRSMSSPSPNSERSQSKSPLLPPKPKQNNPIKEKGIICAYCGLQFPANKLLQQHLKSEHDVPERKRRTKKIVSKNQGPMPKIGKCDECGLVFERMFLLRAHIRKNHATKAHQCEQCGNTFRAKAYLRIHVDRAHKGIRKYECLECNGRFSTKATLVHHCAAQHTGPNLCACNYCDERFGNPVGRRKHLVQEHPELHLKEKSKDFAFCL